MKNLLAYLQLARIGNVLFVGLFQVLLRWCVILPLLDNWQVTPIMTTSQFILLVIATMALTASGNVINDYFDVIPDSINRPHTQVVDRIIDRKTTLLIHVLLTLIGVFCGLFLSFLYKKETHALFFISMPIILWFYSTHFKKQMLIGNMTVALLTASVAFLTTSSEISFIEASGNVSFLGTTACDYLWKLTALIAFFAFITTLTREIIKDMEDIQGDAQCNCHTLPIDMGIRNSKVIVILLQIFTLFILWMSYYYLSFLNDNQYIWLYLIIAITIPTIINCILTIRAKNNNDYHKISSYSKIIMGLGSLIMLYVHLF